MTTPPTPEAVEAAIAYSSINHKVDAMSEDVQRILWANVKPDCTGYSSAYALTAARILAAEVERLRAKEDGGCASEWRLSKGAEENPSDGTIVGECSGGQFVVFAPSKIPIYCPGCGRKVKIQTNDQ